MASTKVLDNVADTIATGDIELPHGRGIIWCEAGSVNIKFQGTIYKSLVAGDASVVELSPGDKIDLVASSASTTVWQGLTDPWIN